MPKSNLPSADLPIEIVGALLKPNEDPQFMDAYIVCSCGNKVHYDLRDAPLFKTLVCEKCQNSFQNHGEKGWKLVGPFKEGVAYEAKFESEYLQTPFEDREWPAYLELAEEYHSRCDEHDDAVCSGTQMIDHKPVSIPINRYESRAVQWNAKDVRQDILNKAMERGLHDAKKLQKAIIHVARNN